MSVIRTIRAHTLLPNMGKKQELFQTNVWLRHPRGPDSGLTGWIRKRGCVVCERADNGANWQSADPAVTSSRCFTRIECHWTTHTHTHTEAVTHVFDVTPLHRSQCAIQWGFEVHGHTMALRKHVSHLPLLAKVWGVRACIMRELYHC